MNLTILEKMARERLKGHSITEASSKLVEARVLSSVEHRAIGTLSWQTVPVANNSAATHALSTSPQTVWL